MFYITYLILALIILIFSNTYYIHILQLEGYKIFKYLEDIINSNDFVKIQIYRQKKAKKALKYTKRVIRILIINYVLNVIILIGTTNLILMLEGMVLKTLLALIFTYLSFTFLPPIITAMAGFILYPVELCVQKYYKNSACNKLKKYPDLVKIAITGSYGKTSCKFILTTILSEKYKTLTTPSSYNTPMGLCKVIRGDLTEDIDVFVCEMGARKPKQITELAKMINAQIGMITSIGNQHLETFKTIENIVDTKYELIEELPQNGVAVFNIDNDYCFKMYKKTKKETLVYGLKQQNANQLLTIKDIRISSKGSNFKLFDKKGDMVFCTTALLGEHNILNILGASTIARHLGLSLEEIANGISKLKPIEHRLEIVPTNNGVTVIDDAFNSNPSGAKMAIDVIAKFTEGGKKIVITPGMIELGKEQYDENFKFGVLMSEVVDVPIIVGKINREGIVEGLKKGGTKEKDIIVVDTLDEATKYLGNIVKANDVVLFENDLPDNIK